VVVVVVVAAVVVVVPVVVVVVVVAFLHLNLLFKHLPPPPYEVIYSDYFHVALL